MSVADDAALSERGLEYHNHGEMREGYKMLYGNLYHPETNPTGYVNLGVSENVRQDSALRSFDLLSSAPPFSHMKSCSIIPNLLGLLRIGTQKRPPEWTIIIFPFHCLP